MQEEGFLESVPFKWVYRDHGLFGVEDLRFIGILGFPLKIRCRGI